MEVAVNQDTHSRYSVSNYLRYCLPTEHKAFMEDVDRFLFQYNAIHEATVGIIGASQNSLLNVLRIVGNASFGWKKPFEKISWSEFTCSREAGGTIISPISLRTVSTAVKVLHEAGIMVSFSQGLGFACHYGLRIANIFTRLYPYYTARIQSCSKDGKLISLWNKLSESPLLPQIDSFIAKFDNQTIKNFSELLKFISDRGGVMGMLGSNAKNAKEYAKKVSREKSVALASQPFFKDDASPNPRAALEYWHKEVRDSELYVTYFSDTTGKTLGQMKNWLNELRKSGYDEKEIRRLIHEYIHRWAHVSEKNREMTAISKNGRPYRCRLSASPEFSFFYANRNNIASILMMTSEPGKTISGNERMSIEEVRRLQN